MVNGMFMPDQQRQELENSFRRTGQIARYTNIMGIKTVSVNLNDPNSFTYRNFS